MGFYIRKSLKFGPLRLNLSKSGVGLSAGVKGFRFGSGPKGNYVHIGKGGIYYRQSVNNRLQQKPNTNQVNNRQHYEHETVHHGEMVEIESKNTLQIIDANSEALVSEIRQKAEIAALFPWVIVGLIILAFFTGGITIILIPFAGTVAYMIDKRRKTTVILYDLDDYTQKEYSEFYDTFENLNKSKRKWHIEAKANVTDAKYHAGAGELVQRKKIEFQMDSPKDIKTNVPVPSIPVGKQTLYFLPDKLLVIEKNSVGAVSYSTLKLDINVTRFIEDEGVPSDAQIVDYTWKYVNKKGGPDKRFKDNCQLPIALYAQIDFLSSTGLRERLNISNVQNAEKFSKAIVKLSNYYKSVESSQSSN